MHEFEPLPEEELKELEEAGIDYSKLNNKERRNVLKIIRQRNRYNLF